MKLKKKLKPKLIDELKQHRDFRDSIMNFTVNYIKNISMRYYLMHKTLKEYNDKIISKDILLVATAQYISSLVTCWETFFRDLVVFTLDNNEIVKENTLIQLAEKGISLEELENEGISVGEFVSKQYNFQDLKDTSDAFNLIFNDNKDSIFEYTTKFFETTMVFSSPNYLLYWIQEKKDLVKNISNVLVRGFELRHNCVHDANFKFTIEPDYMTKLEDCFTLFPQIISIWLAKQYNQNLIYFNETTKHIRMTNNPAQDETPIIFSRKDFEADYEEVVE